MGGEKCVAVACGLLRCNRAIRSQNGAKRGAGIVWRDVVRVNRASNWLRWLLIRSIKIVRMLRFPAVMRPNPIATTAAIPIRRRFPVSLYSRRFYRRRPRILRGCNV